jgi:cytochrome c553
MRHSLFPTLLALGAALALAACGPAKAPAGASLAWAYPKAAKGPLPEVPPGPQHVPGSQLSFTGEQLNKGDIQPDWFPQEHPRPPAVVVQARKDGPDACAECHMISGQGYLATPNLSGLPAGYIIQQVEEFRSGRRLSWEKDRPATHEMIEVARKVSDQELAQAAAYFAALPKVQRFKVVEADQVPATHANYYGWLELTPNAAREPVGGRVIEVAEDFPRMMLGDPHTGVVDYVAPGAIARGEALVKAGGHNGQPCAACHGADLRGMGDTPALAGRSAAYLARMLWDIKTGARQGPAVTAMQAPTAHLNEADIADVVAYLASLPPSAPAASAASAAAAEKEVAP